MEGIALHTVSPGDRLEATRSLTGDTVWLPRLALDAPDVVIVTADPRIARSPWERAAWLQSGLTAFFFKSFADLSRWSRPGA